MAGFIYKDTDIHPNTFHKILKLQKIPIAPTPIKSRCIRSLPASLAVNGAATTRSRPIDGVLNPQP